MLGVALPDSVPAPGEADTVTETVGDSEPEPVTLNEPLPEKDCDTLGLPDAVPLALDGEPVLDSVPLTVTLWLGLLVSVPGRSSRAPAEAVTVTDSVPDCVCETVPEPDSVGEIVGE